MLYCHTLFLGTEGLGDGCVKIMLIVSWHLEWLTCLLLFIMVGFEKLQPRFEDNTHFSDLVFIDREIVSFSDFAANHKLS